MKLFMVRYMDDCETDSFLTVGNSKEEVEERIDKQLSQELSCYMYSFVREISEVNGHKITVE